MIAKKIKSSRKLRVFIITLLLSAFLWFINHLAGEFNVKVDIDVHITNIPAYYDSSHFSDSGFQINISGSGFALIRYHLKDQKTINIDFSQLKRQDAEDKHIFYVPKPVILESIQRELPSNISISEFDYSHISYSLTSYPKKKLPVYAKLDYQCADGYMVLGQVIILPDSILIEGPSKKISNIDSILAIHLFEEKLRDSVNISVPIEINDADAWMYSKTSVDIQIPVIKVKRLSWTDHFQAEIDGKVYVENIEMEAWVPEYTNKVKVKFRHKVKNNEIIITPQLNTQCRLIRFNPTRIPLLP